MDGMFYSQELSRVFGPVVYRMAVSFLCGAIVGAERESRGKAAGLRTNILICLGATLFTIASELMATYVAKAPQEATRIAAQVVTGVGFLGAGAILRSGRGIRGLTTAATIWLVSAIGVVVGCGFPVLGLVTAIMTVLTLVVLGRIEGWVMGACDMRTIDVKLGPGNAVGMARLEAVLEAATWPTRIETIQLAEGETKVTINYCARHASHRAVLSDLGDVLH